VTTPLVIAVSPYHLTTREAPAFAALLLADRVVTLLPAPPAGRSRDDVRRAVSKSPRYLRLMESWRWTIPLWHAGVLGAALGGEDPGADLRSFYARIADADEYAGLRPLTRHAAEANPDQFLDLLANDILKGGPDPGLNIPVSAALDDFAARHDIVVARAAATSVAQRAELSAGQRVFSVPLPILTRASAGVILHLRDELAPQLSALRSALLAAAHAPPGAPGPAASPGRRAPLDAGVSDPLAAAARDYTASFASLRDDLQGHDDDEGIRITTGYIGVTALVLPADVAMRSGLAAARAMNMRGSTPRAPARATPPAPEPLVVLVMKPLAFEPDKR
jgi:hypothetical protein